MEAAQFAIRCNPTVQRCYQRKQAKSPLMVARKAVAHTLSRACYDSMRALVPYDGDDPSMLCQKRADKIEPVGIGSPPRSNNISNGPLPP